MAIKRKNKAKLTPLVLMLEMTEWNEVQQLCKNHFAAIHVAAPSADQIGNNTALWQQVISNRRNG